MKFKKIVVFIIIVYILALLSNTSMATSVEEFNVPATEEFKGIGQVLVTVFTSVGMVVSVVTLIVIGIKYMVGSVEERASYKRTLFPYLMGAGFVFAASAIANIIYNIAIGM